MTVTANGEPRGADESDDAYYNRLGDYYNSPEGQQQIHDRIVDGGRAQIRTGSHRALRDDEAKFAGRLLLYGEQWYGRIDSLLTMATLVEMVANLPDRYLTEEHVAAVIEHHLRHTQH